MSTIVSVIPEEPERDKKKSLFFQEGRHSFKAEILFCQAGVLFLEGYDYKAKYRRQIELLASCFEEGSTFDEVLRDAGYTHPWQKIYGVLIPMGNIPVLISRYNHNVDNIMKDLEEQIKKENKVV